MEMNKDSKIKFTNRELDVIWFLSKGLSNKQIANCMQVKERTVKTHLEHIYLKLNIHNRVQLMEFAYMHGLINRNSLYDISQNEWDLNNRPIIQADLL